MRKKISNLKQENVDLFNDLNLKDEEIFILNDEINKLEEKIKCDEFQFLRSMGEKNMEIDDLRNKLGEMDGHLQKYENDLFSISNNYEKNILDYQKDIEFRDNEIQIRDNEIERLRAKHENEKRIVFYYLRYIFVSFKIDY